MLAHQVAFAVVALVYVAPGPIAPQRHVRKANSVWVMDLFLGWTVIGWVMALAMAVRDVDRPT